MTRERPKMRHVVCSRPDCPDCAPLDTPARYDKSGLFDPNGSIAHPSLPAERDEQGCDHPSIIRFSDEQGEHHLWACAKCALRFSPGREAAAPSVEELAEALRNEGAVRGVAGRYGKFNEVYWDNFAEAILARLSPPTDTGAER